MNITEYDATADFARLTAEGYEPDQIVQIMAVRRRHHRFSARAQAMEEEMEASRRRDRADREQSCPFLTLIGALRSAFR